MNFKLYFNQLKVYQKIELYLLVIMFYGSILYFYSDIFIIKNTKNTTIIKHKDINSFKNKIVKKDQLFFIKYIEKNIKKYNLFSNTIKINNNTIKVSLNGKYNDIINFIKNIEQHLILKNIILQKDKRKIVLNLTIKIDYFYNLLASNLSDTNVPNPFLKIKEKKILKTKNLSLNLNLSAIIGDIVYINEKPYKKYDTISGYKIIKIDLNSVVLKQKDKYLTLRLYDDK